MKALFVISTLLLAAACAPQYERKDELPPLKEDQFGPKKDQKTEDPAPKPEDPVPVVVKNWITKDMDLDGVPGTSADRAYALSFVKAKVDPIVVAIIDSGVDITHEDLKGLEWVNAAEANGKVGVDDDGNGYIDDLNGWNYLGSYDAKGAPTHIEQERLEVTRESARMKELKALREAQGKTLTAEELVYHDKVTKQVAESIAEDTKVLAETHAHEALAKELIAKVASLAAMAYEKIVLKDIQDAATLNADEEATKTELLKLFTDNRLRSTAHFQSRIEAYEEELNYYYNEAFNPRAKVIGDDPSDFKNIGYGNNVVWGPLDADNIASEASHGTHVAGIIGASRDNGIGVSGIARDVRFLSLRAVPNGDEYDKDVANSVRYATNNGAKIINMSFAKGYSPYKKEVDAAFEYAASKGVLFVHAAGNEASNNDKEDNFPNRFPVTNPSTSILGWLEVGASSELFDETLVASFSNFGKVAVDLFAPGVAVESSIPGNGYAKFSGTSMASPSTAGVAALVWSQFPTLNAQEVMAIITASVASYPDKLVKSPETGKLVAFSSLSRTGGIANAYNAMKRACEYTGEEICK